MNQHITGLNGARPLPYFAEFIQLPDLHKNGANFITYGGCNKGDQIGTMEGAIKETK